MWQQLQESKPDGTGPRRVRLGLLTSAISLSAMVWLLASGVLPLHQLGMHARLRWLTTSTLDVNQPSRLHGSVRKAGPIDLKLFYPQRMKECTVDWQQLTTASGQGNLTQPPCSGCQVYVNHLYKIIYLRQPKVASTSILSYFGQCTAERSEETGCLRVWRLATPIPTTKEVAARPTYQPLYNISELQVSEIWQDYFVFTAVRNPFSRATSQYRTALLNTVVETAECTALAEDLDWDRACDAPLDMVAFCVRYPQCCFLGAKHGVPYRLVHLAPMAPCMTTPDGRLAADFVVRYELLKQDLQDLLKHLNARQGVPKLVLGQMQTELNVWPRCPPTQSSHHIKRTLEINDCANDVGKKCMVSWQALEAKEQYCSMQAFYTGRHAHCRAGIATFYAQDLRLLYGGGLAG